MGMHQRRSSDCDIFVIRFCNLRRGWVWILVTLCKWRCFHGPGALLITPESKASKFSLQQSSHKGLLHRRSPHHCRESNRFRYDRNIHRESSSSWELLIKEFNICLIRGDVTSRISSTAEKSLRQHEFAKKSPKQSPLQLREILVTLPRQRPTTPPISAVI